jgi:hypothetical protein
MNPHALRIMNAPAIQSLGSRIQYRSQRTLRTRRGEINRISAMGVLVIGSKGKPAFVPWENILEIYA